MKVGVDQGVGCYTDKMPKERTKTIAVRPVPSRDRHTFNLKDRSFGRADLVQPQELVDAIKQAQAASGIKKGARGGRWLPSCA
jgi:7,8-dihydropterin-6-yl-methyl-4-(beta-D-ribofuranosyl)aminobenzene 5'-phosphate synthase